MFIGMNLGLPDYEGVFSGVQTVVKCCIPCHSVDGEIPGFDLFYPVLSKKLAGNLAFSIGRLDFEMNKTPLI